MSTCEQTFKARQFLSGELSEAEVQELELHAGGCPTCMELLRGDTPYLDAVAQGHRETPIESELPVEPPAGFLRQVQEAGPSDGDQPTAQDAQSLPEISFPGQRTEEVPLGRLEDFLILRLVARGGYGAVYEALEKSTGNKVAIKVLRPEPANDARHRERFCRDAEAAESIASPYVVKVLRVRTNGSPGFALPYFVMDYVEGESLAQYLERVQSLEKVQSLEPVIAARVALGVARGLAAIHERGIIHRDIKPGNILLPHRAVSGQGANISPLDLKITDFGLASRAEVLDTASDSSQSAAAPMSRPFRGASLTRLGEILGTPDYMSPEQCKGTNDIDFRSDIFSLGVVLYELLTGERPFRGTTIRIVEQIRTDDPKPPRKLIESLPADLETITLKCLAKEANRRFPTASELADDLHRWLAGNPILSRRASPMERAWSWSCRHPAASVAVSAVLIGLIAVSALSLALWGTNQRLSTANIDLQLANTAERKAKNNADKNAADARAAKSDAEAHAARAEVSRKAHESLSSNALEAYQTLIYDVNNKLAADPTLRPLAEALLKLAAAGLRKVARPNPEAARIADHRLATAQMKLGDLFLLLKGIDDAEERYREALAICEQSLKDNPDHFQSKRNRTLAISKLGDTSLQRGQPTEALKWYAQAAEVQQALADEHPSNALFLRDLGIARTSLGDVSRRLGKPRDARQHFEAALIDFQQVVILKPDNREALLSVAVALERLGGLLQGQGEPVEAVEYFRQSLQKMDSIATHGRSDAEFERTKSVTHENLGICHLDLENVEAAREHLTQCLRIRQTLHDSDPRNAGAKQDLATVHEHLGALSRMDGRIPDARQHHHDARIIRAALVAQDVANADFQRELAVSHENLGELCLDLNDLPEAEQHHRQALELRELLAGRDRDDSQALRDVSVSCRQLATTLSRRCDYDQSRELFERSLRIREELLAKNPQNIQAHLDVAAVCEHYGDLERSLHQPAPALKQYQRALELFHLLEREGKFKNRNAVIARIREVERKNAVGSLAIRLIQDQQFVFSEQSDITADALLVSSVVLARNGQRAAATKAAERFHQIDPRSPDHVYNLACCFSLCAAATSSRPDDESTPREQDEDRSYFIIKAVEALIQSIEFGFQDYKHIDVDPDLTAIRDDRRYENVLDRIVQFYDTSEKPDQATEWRKRLDGWKAKRINSAEGPQD